MIAPRRHLLAATLLGLLAAPGSAFAQPKDRLIRIGWLGNTEGGTPQARAIREALLDELQRRGWIQGRNLLIEFRYADGLSDRFPVHARELVDQKVDLIVAVGGNGADAAKQVTKTIPVVFVSVPAPVEQGLVDSLARPGGNLTGLSTQSHEIIGKRLGLLKEAFPRTTRVAVLGVGSAVQTELINLAAADLSLQLMHTPAEHADELAKVIAAQSAADAWFITDSQLHFAHRKTIVDAIARQRKPAIYPMGAFVAAGGLMSYSLDLKDQFRRAGEMVDRILRGAKPADIPVEQPIKFALAFNLTTARAQGLTIPQSLLLRAEEVIE
jgi:putative tryptophan/tyrosine transport system substrate-binding protein